MKKIVLSFVFFLLVSFVCPVFAQAQSERIIDNAGLLSSSEEAELADLISGLEKKYGVNLVLLTVPPVALVPLFRQCPFWALN